MVQTRLHKHSLSKKEQAVSSVASRASVRDPIDEFQDVYGSRAASAAFRQQLGSDFSRSGQSQPPIQAKPSFRGLSHALAPIQAKLTVGPANDIYEQEADRVAAQVVQRIHAPVSNSSAQGESVQRQEDEDELQLKPIAPIQRKDMSERGEVSTDLESEINRARGGGQPLAPELQAKMGEAMGADFSEVRVHTDGRADALNQSVGARAFTTGQDLFFKRGEYEPGSRGGQELIAHELTHVVQQNGGAVQRSTKLSLGQSTTNQVVQRTRESKRIEYAEDAEDAIQWFTKKGRDLDDYPLEEAELAIKMGCTKTQGLVEALKILGSEAQEASRAQSRDVRVAAVAQTRADWDDAFHELLAELVFDAWMTGYEDLRWNIGVTGTYNDNDVNNAIEEIDAHKGLIENLTNVHYFRRQDKAKVGKGNVGATLARRKSQANFIAKVHGRTVNVHVDLE